MMLAGHPGQGQRFICSGIGPLIQWEFCERTNFQARDELSFIRKDGNIVRG